MNGPKASAPSASPLPVEGDESRAPSFPWWLRLILGSVGVVLIALLITTAFLTPSPRGLGTHRQLGLPACASTQFFGVRCPSCGMTTSWAYLVRGRLIASQQSNTGGMLLGLVSMFVGPWLLLTGLRGWWVWVVPSEWVVVAIGVALIGVTLIDWTYRLMVR